MAYLRGVPKYAFGTAFDLVPDCDSLPKGEDSSSEASVNRVSWTSQEEKQQLTDIEASTTSCNKQPMANCEQHDTLQQQQCDGLPLANAATLVPKHSTQMTEKQFKQFLKDAMKLGCRHFDCAPLYKTQHLVGQALSETIEKLSVPRQQFFITSKLPPNMMKPEDIERSIRSSIEELKVNYLDLFLIHAPFATRHNNQSDSSIYPVDTQTGETILDDDEQFLEKAWLKLVDLKRRGLTRYIGISNVNLEQLIRLNSLHHVDVVQNEYHIYNQDRELFDYCEEIDVHFEAYAAFGSPERARAKGLPCVFADPLVTHVARRNRITVAQVLMQWIHQQPLSYVIKCDNMKQLAENLKATKSCSVSVNEMIDLDTLNKNVRIYTFDEHRGLTKHREYPFNIIECDQQQQAKDQIISEQQNMQAKLHNISRQFYPKKNNNNNEVACDDSEETSCNGQALADLKESIQRIYNEHRNAASQFQQHQNQQTSATNNIHSQSDSCDSSTPTIIQTPPRLGDIDDDQLATVDCAPNRPSEQQQQQNSQ